MHRTPSIYAPGKSPASHLMTLELAAAAAKSLQSCPTLCDPTDSSPPGSPIPGILQARTLEWVAISFSNAWKWKVKVKSLSCVQLLATPWTAAHLRADSSKSGLLSVLLNKVLLKDSLPIHLYVICAVFAQQRQSCIVATQTMWPAKPKILIFWFFTEKVCESLL